MPEHLPLPRAIGAYRTVHLTKIVPSSARYFLAGFMSTTSGGKDRMSNIIAMESVNAAGGVNAANNTRRFVHSTGLANMNCAPAAMTVKVMANEPLQTATGTVRLGQAQSKLNLNDEAASWDAVFDVLLSHSRFVATSVASLAVNPIEASALPVELGEMAEFRPMYDYGEGLVTWNNTMEEDYTGFAPILISNEAGKSLIYEIQMEFRVRPDYTSPFTDGMRTRKPSSEATWAETISALIEGGIQVANTVQPFVTAAAAMIM